MRAPANPKWDQVAIGALARKAKLPKYYFDTTDGRDALGRFAEAVLAAHPTYVSSEAEKIDKLTWQVRDTCTRAERAEGCLRLSQSALRQWTEKYAHLQNACGERVSRVLDYNLPPADHLKALEAIEEHFQACPTKETP